MLKFKERPIFLLIAIFSLVLFVASCARKTSQEEKVTGGQVKSDSKEIMYYTCGMHPQIRVSVEEYNKGKTKDPICGMDLVPVYKEKAVKKSTGPRKILYYRNPMNPEVTSPVPRKDSMGMDYIPVYEDEVASPKAKGVIGNVSLQREQIIRANVNTTPVRLLHLFKEIRTVGRIAYDPALAVAQEEFITALESHDRISEGGIKEITRRSEELLEASRRKLRLLGMSQGQIEELEKTRKIQTNLILPEDRVWVYADVYECELSWVKEGHRVKVITAAFPGEEFKGTIKSINPTLDPKTRSVRIRLEIENPDMKLKPDMYVDVFIESTYISPEGSHKVLAVPREAVLDTGLRKIAWVDLGGGEFQAREVEVGPEATTEIDGKRERYLPILRGLNEGELVVTKGNFLIDSQSQLTGVAAAAYGGALEAEEGAKHTH